MTMTKPSELVAMYILGTDDEATVIHLLSSYIRQGSRKEVFDSIKVKLKKGNVSEQIKVVQLMDDLVQQTAMHSTAVLSAETWMQRLWKIFKNTKSNELQNAMHHVVVRWAGVYGYRTLAQMAQRMEYHLHPELKKARSIQKQRSFLNPSSHADASKIEQFFIQLHEDTAKFEVALQRPELMNDHLAQKMVHHHEHLIAILEHDNLAENIRLILKNEENQIGELLEVGCAIFGEDFFLEVGVPPGTASSSEQRKKSTSQHRTLPANIVALHESIRHLQVQIDYEKEEEKNSMDRIAELDHEIQLQQTTGSMTRSMSSSAVPQAQQTASASRKKAQMVKKNYLLSQIRTMSKSVAHARDELNDLKVYYKQLVSQQKGAFQKLDRILAALPRALAQEQNTEQNVHMRLKELYLNERRLRQQYFNTIQDLKGSLRRFCRIRPREQGQPTCLIPNTRVGEVILNMEGKPKRFEFDSIFPDSQEEIFEEVKNLVDGILNGYNVCFATYGATGSGKSYTLFGEPSNVGLLHRTIATIFHGASERQETLTVEISAFEITQKEDILDLLTGQGTSLELVRSGSNLTCITDLSSTTLRNADNLDVELCGLLERLSSISPASIGVCQVQIETKNRVTNLVNVRRASFIDMCAVSETDNGNSTKPLINAFQVTLTAAAHASAPPSSHVSSKLLTYMQDYTREMGKLALILCLDGSVQKVKQTHATLQFGARCCA